MLNLDDSKAMLAEVLPQVKFPEVKEMPLCFGEGIVHPTKKALVGILDGIPNIYAEPSEKYQLVRHEEMVANTIDYIQSSDLKDLYGNPVFEPKLWGNGSKMKFTVKFPQSELTVTTPQGISKVSPQISLVNSYDLTKKLQILFEAMQLVCSNGLVALRAIAGIKQKHMSGINLPEQLGTIHQALSAYPEQCDTWSKLSRVRLSAPEFEDWITGIKVGSVPLFGQRYLDDVMNLKMIGTMSHPKTLIGHYNQGSVNMWDAHNAITQFITHNVESEDVKLVKSQVAESAFMKLLK